MKRILALLLSITILLVCVACAAKTGPDEPQKTVEAEPTGDNTQMPASDAPDEIKIGVIGPMTGDTAVLGEQMKNLCTLVEKQLNDTGGINGIPVKFYYEDDKGDSSSAALAAQKLIDVTGVQVILGPLFTSCVLAVKPIATAAKVPVLVATSANQEIFAENGYVFSLDAADEISVELLAKYLFVEKGFKDIAMLGEYNDQTLNMFTLFDKAWTEYGGSVVYSSTFNAGAEDFRTELTKIKDAAPDVIWCKATAEEFMTLGRQIVELGLDDVFIATDFQAVQDESIYDVIGSAVDGRLAYTRNGVANDDTTRAIYNAFESAYMDAYGVEPEAHICLLYDCIQLIVRAMETGSYSGDALRVALLGLQNEPGCCGYVTFDNFGRSEGSSTIAVYQNGGVEILNYSMTD